MIERKKHYKEVCGLLRRHPVVAIIGARQVGKTTLAREISTRWRGQTTTYDLEDPADLARLSDPMLALRDKKGLVVIDEIQHFPNLFPVLRVLVDRPHSSVRFLVLGSASPKLLRQSSESLAGRIYYYELRNFSLEEVGMDQINRLWIRGGFPNSFLAKTNRASAEWRRAFIKTFLERDIPQLGISIPALTLQRFWSMLAHYHGQVWNASEFARSFDVSDNTVRNYLDLLTSTFVVRRLSPFWENIGKRQVKAPKVFLSDSGLLHSLLNLESFQDLERHPKVGSSWEGFALEQVIHRIGARRDESYFWATHSGAELDLLIIRGRKRWGFEFKRTVAPKRTRSMLLAMADLNLTNLFIIHAGDQVFPIGKKMKAVALSSIGEELPLLRSMS